MNDEEQSLSERVDDLAEAVNALYNPEAQKRALEHRRRGALELAIQLFGVMLASPHTTVTVSDGGVDGAVVNMAATFDRFLAG